MVVFSVKKDKMIFFKIFRRKKQKPQPKQLRIDGCKTTLTAEPDDAELAAQALLESSLSHGTNKPHDPHETNGASTHDTAYHRAVSEKIIAARQQETRSTMRFLAYCEQQLKMYDGRGKKADGSISEHTALNELEQGLYRHQDCIEREGGDLKRRWQKCLATVIVRQMSATDSTDDTEENDITTD